MLDAAQQTNALAYYAKHGAALFPVPYGKKDPTGIVLSFKHDFSRDPQQWSHWQTEHKCNFGVVAFASNWIICDIDTHEIGRDAAWAEWCKLCAEWGVAPISPNTQSCRGGWHCYFALPDGIDASTLRQPDAIRKIINVRCIGYVVAAGSYYDGTAKGEQSGAYLLMSDAAPTIAPDALIKHCTRAERTAAANPVVGSRDMGDTASLIKWLAERDGFTAYEDWVSIGMALRVEFGDSGLDLWALTHDATVTPDAAVAKWQSFATEPTTNSITLNSWLKRARDLGWRGSVGKSTEAMFGQVAHMAHAAGATLAEGTPGPANTDNTGGLPMLAGQARLAELAQPMLDAFLNGTSDCPTRPLSNGYPTLPESQSTHALYGLMSTCIDRIIAMGETPKSYKAVKVIDPLAVLLQMNPDIYESVARTLRAFGRTLPAKEIKLTAARLENNVQRSFHSNDQWVCNIKGEKDADNSDNIAVFMGIIGCEIRFNEWINRAEVKGFEYPEWTILSDAIVANLYDRARQTKTDYKVSISFLWLILDTLARRNSFDPVLARIAELESSWDKTPRLSDWLANTCGVPSDRYHQAVARNIIGGMVRRARHPGAKHDTMAILFGPQGTGKTTLAAIIADMGMVTLPQIILGKGSHYTDAVKLGDEAKELILALAGKLVAEIGEMGMRGNADPAAIKKMLTATFDEGRPAYERSTQTRYRRNIFFGTTNDERPLTDTTGNRRFLPVNVAREIDLQWISDNIAQIVGEAAVLESAGDDFQLPREIWKEAGEHAEAARGESDIETLLNSWFGETQFTTVAYVTAEELIELARLANWRGAPTLRTSVMKRLGFRDVLVMVEGKRQHVWARGDVKRPADIVKIGARYFPTVSPTGRPGVVLRSSSNYVSPHAMPELPPGTVLPPPPQ